MNKRKDDSIEKNISIKYMKEEDPLVLCEGSFYSDCITGKCKLETTEALKVNETLLIRFYISNPFEYAEAKVRIHETIKKPMSSSFQSGIEFLHISSSLLDRIL